MFVRERGRRQRLRAERNTSSSDRNLVSGASEGPAVAPSAVAAGMGAGSAKDGEFPRTVGHFEGRTEIRSAPKKIAALGASSWTTC